MKRAALMGDGWYPYLFTVRRLKASNEAIRAYAAEAGRDLAGFHWGLNQPTAISHDREEALAAAVERLTAAGHGRITIEIMVAPEFYFAEDYHQQYLAKNPTGYCALRGVGLEFNHA